MHARRRSRAVLKWAMYAIEGFAVLMLLVGVCIAGYSFILSSGFRAILIEPLVVALVWCLPIILIARAARVGLDVAEDIERCRCYLARSLGAIDELERINGTRR